MKIINKITGRDVTKEYNGLLGGLITNEEFEVITMTPSKDKEIQVPCSAEQDWAWHYESE
jgi:hypothetical protein|tara:strand:- start:1317 stop:1496 length:180 start_codon:yes stop_codon:yes gene_type:complete